MSERFAAGAQMLAGLLPRALGWTPQQFWDATPAEIAAILCPEGIADAAVTRVDLSEMMERERDG